ncbi:glycosyltransferase group 2 family protein [Alishewanella agri BL06]|uniref:Glycosyltransferase group 2 family protein n=1 Tax=Alishewanella agri BL06 TaxID=1195246 RepID=I9P661_9ALTE|nr:glycosyltransferase [Alishewanella agri]EIW90359.1 glycosyltransferase group 2 family protein [Alishewanella agri BL06]
MKKFNLKEKSELDNYILSVIIATSARKEREKSILQAIKSIRAQEDVSSTIIIVANGQSCAPDILNKLCNMEGVELYYFPDKDFPTSLLIGRQKVRTPYFSFLDDDDEYISDTLKEIIFSLEQDKNLDLVVGNGVRFINNADRIRFPSIKKFKGNELKTLVSPGGNWLASCAAIYRTSSIGEVYFTDFARYCEWTYLAFKLSLEKNIGFIDVISYRIHDSQESLSKGLNYQIGQFEALKKIYNLNLPSSIRTKVLNKISDQAHSISGLKLNTGNFGESWHYHVISLRSFSGIRYLLYTRKILIAFFKDIIWNKNGN